MQNISKTTREKLALAFCIRPLAISRVIESRHKDAVKFAFTLNNPSETIESVLLYDDTRRTACISSQLGCALGCSFCQTGTAGFARNLLQHEIVGQLMGMNNYLAAHNDKLITNIVFMGMGEALLNFENCLAAVRVIMDDNGLGIGGRKITISTAGIVPGIMRLIKENLNLGLAISLNSFCNAQRSELMPVNKQYPIEELVAAARTYFNAVGRRVTFEYVCIAGVNDTDEAARTLGSLLAALSCKVNLIGLNPTCRTATMTPPDSARMATFAEMLRQQGLAVTIRASRGRDISGACGQLAAAVKNSSLS
jgi:23S rRNA (adenine2503-C2)-methyltransferase